MFHFSVNQIVLKLSECVPGSRTYRAPWDFVWNIGRGADPSSLRQSVADFLARPVEQIAIAKHFYSRHEWVVIKDGATGQVRGNDGVYINLDITFCVSISEEVGHCKNELYRGRISLSTKRFN